MQLKWNKILTDSKLYQALFLKQHIYQEQNVAEGSSSKMCSQVAHVNIKHIILASKSSSAPTKCGPELEDQLYPTSCFQVWPTPSLGGRGLHLCKLQSSWLIGASPATGVIY